MILCVDSSSVSASCAVMDGDKLIKSDFVNSGLTHSETLLPMIKNVIADYKMRDFEAVAITNGPGSFTGVRIGVATVKGLCFNENIPVIPVSSLEAVAYNYINENKVVAVLMDARRMQFYNAFFSVNNGIVTRICNDRASSLEDIEKDIEKYENVIIAGDGAKLFCENTKLDNVSLSTIDKMFVTGQGIGLASKNKEKISHNSLMPMYLRLSQAERELKLKKEK